METTQLKRLAAAACLSGIMTVAAAGAQAGDTAKPEGHKYKAAAATDCTKDKDGKALDEKAAAECKAAAAKAGHEDGAAKEE